MFPTFISILDIQSWWEVPSIAHFCSLFRTAFNLLDFDIEDLEEALLTDGTEESSWLQELIVRLLSGCLPNNEISTFNYQMFLRRLFRQKCQEHDRYNPFNTDIDFQLLPLRTKVDILHALCDFRLDADDVLDQLKNLEADSLRVEPLGYDGNESAYWYFYGTRLYREDFKTKNNKKKSIWQVICFTEDDWFQLTKKFKKSTCKAERQLHHTLNENFLPELPRLFKEKESQARKRLLENLPRRTSSRLRKLEIESEKEVEPPVQSDKVRLEEEERQKKRDLEKRRQEAYERRARLKEQSEEDSVSEESEKRYEMAGTKTKKAKGRQRKISTGSASGKDVVVPTKTSKRNKKNDKSDDVPKTSSSKPTTVGRQTNNSLSAATGQILIQPVANVNKKKLKTSQVFRQTDEDLQTGMHKILDYVKNHEDAWPFADPVEEEYAPNYYTVIRKPMDLQRMEERLESGYYKNYSKFRGDFQLIVDNCRLYNGAENEYTEMVGNLLQVFEKATEKYLDQISSSDDDIAVEFLDIEADNKNSKKKKEEEIPATSKRKPMLAAQTDRKRDRSISEESIGSKRSDSYASLDNVSVKTVKSKKVEKVEKVTKKQAKTSKGKKEKSDSKKDKAETKKDKTESKKEKTESKKEKIDSKKEKSDAKKDKTENKKLTKENKYAKTKKSLRKQKKKSPVRSRSSSRSPSRSPPRSDRSSPPPSSPDSRFDFFPKKNPKKRQSQGLSESEDSLPKGKQKKHGKFNDIFEEEKLDHSDKKLKKEHTPPLSPKPKDKHNKLRETIEKLKAKSEIAKIKSCEYDFELDDHLKENKDKNKKHEKDDKIKVKTKEKSAHKSTKKDFDLDLDNNSTMDSIQSESKKSKKVSSKNNSSINKNPSTMDALSIATEQTLKDINKWLDDTPKFSEFSSASNSPSYTGLDEFDTLTSKIDQVPGKKVDKPIGLKKEGVKDFKRRPFRDPAKFFKRREVQRTIDRLQPGKSKGNLITNVQSTNKVDEIFPLGPLSKIKDTKNSLIVKTDTNAPKLSLGSVLDSFGKHKFVDDQKKEEEKSPVEIPKEEILQIPPCKDIVEDNVKKDIVKEITEVKEDSKEKSPTIVEDNSGGGATPNLSAWFKAFGAPKMPPPPKKCDSKTDGKENEKCEDSVKSGDARKVSVPVSSPNPDSPVLSQEQPIPRQRKISTGSSMSERSSFSQDMDSPRVGMDERGAYPAPYPSPLHRSPSGASPVMASPRPDISPKAAAYPTINGQIRVGFYQDTVSNKSSPDKSCSPREIPQSPYPQYSEHVYTPNTTENPHYSYANSPYYSHAPNYSSTNPTPPYNMEASNSSYYDTSKSLTDQYQAKTMQNYTANSPASNQSSPVPHPQHSPNIHSQHSPGMHAQLSPGVYSQHSPGVHSPHSPQHSPGVHPQHSPGLHPQHSPGVHPQHSPGVHPQHSPGVHPQHSPGVHPQHSPGVHPQHSPGVHSQHSPGVHPQNSPGVHQQHSPNVLPQNSPSIHPQLSPTIQHQNSPIVHSQHSPSIYPQHSPNVQPQHSHPNSPIIHPQSPSVHPHSPIVNPHSPNVLHHSPNMETFHQEEQNKIPDKVVLPSQSAMFPVKKRAYNEIDNMPINTERFEVDSRLSQRETTRNLQMGEQVNLETMNVQESSAKQENKEVPKPYVHQNIPDPKPLSVQTSVESFNKGPNAPPTISQQQLQQQSLQMQKELANIRNVNYTAPSVSSAYGSSFSNDSNYPLNIPTARPLTTPQENKVDMSKYTNMGYTGPDANYNRTLQQFNRPDAANFTRTTVPLSAAQKQHPQQTVTSASQGTALQQIGYKTLEMIPPTTNPQQAHTNFNTSVHPSTRSSDSITDRLSQIPEVPSGYKSEVSIPRPYNAPIDVDQPLGLGRNIANLSHIVDRFNNDECMIAGLQTSASYYSDKGLGTSHVFNKPISTSASGLPMFSQANMAAMQSYNQNVQGTASTMYNRQATELQNPGIMQNESKPNLPSQATQEKKTKKRKSSKSVTSTNPTETPQTNSTNQGFQSYAGLKGNPSIEPSAISLKTSSVVPGSAFNFGPTPTGLGIGSGLYGDKDAYPNFLEEFRSAPNYYMAAAAAAHHRSTPESSEKQTRPAHQNSTPQTAPGYPFLGGPQARPTYPIGGPFIPNAQAQLMDTSSPIYQHYLQAGVLNQGLLGPPGAYPPGYHPALSMRQQYDSMTRPTWL